MPTFPSSPLSFRTASFPQYGWKAGISDSAFPRVAQVKPVPGIPYAPRRFASNLRALRSSSFHPALCRDREPDGTPPFEEFSPLPQRPSLRSGLYCPGPSTLNRPHPPHSWAQHDFAALRLIRTAFAVRVRRGDPRVVPSFRVPFLLDMSSSTTPGDRRLHAPSFFPADDGLRPMTTGSATPSSHNPFPVGDQFRSFNTVHFRYNLSSCLPP
jgi:hypothetical protein